jgi:lipid II isoglutaminyl synthase (glutamine-hydrolysing)
VLDPTAHSRGGAAARLRLARAAATTASALSRATRRGAGTTIGGRVALAIAPDALAGVSRDRVLACVTGTNGKTTTTRLLSAALSHTLPVLTNGSGANLTSGLVGALSSDLHRPAVLEVDELHLPGVVSSLVPRVVVLLNLSRDQLDRTSEAQRAAAGWREALPGLGRSTVVANCDDPRVVWAAQASPNTLWVAAGQTWTADGHVCPHCGYPIRYDIEGDRSGHGPVWSCQGCGFHRPTPDAVVAGDRLLLPEGEIARISLRLPGRANLSNAAMAAMAAAELGVPASAALSEMRDIGQVEGRYAEFPIGRRRVRLLLAKNPSGWAETMQLVGTGRRPLLLAMNARPVDGRDTSWLYDVPFEQIAGHEVTVTGAAAADMSLRLTYAGVPHREVHGLRQALLASAQLHGGRADDFAGMDAIADYSSFQELRRLAANGE